MFDREPNIDIVFRNGLKNFEVLPPSDLWDSIHPTPVIHRNKRIGYSIAAAIALLMTLSMAISFLVRKPVSAGTQLAVSTSDGKAMASQPESQPVAAKNDAVTSAQKPVKTEMPVTRVHDEAIIKHLDTSVPSLSTRQTAPEIKRSNTKAAVILRENQIAVTQWIKDNDFFNTDKSLAATTGQKNDVSKFMLGASYSPAMNIMNSGDNSGIEELLNNEKTLPSYTAGISVAYKVNSRFSIQAGLSLASRGQLITDVDVKTGLARVYSSKGPYNYIIQTASGNLYAVNGDVYIADVSSDRVANYIPEGDIDPAKEKLTYINSDIRQLFRYLEIPVVARYKLVDRKIDLNISGGLAYGFLVENVAYAVNGTELVKIGYTEGIRNYSLSSQMGFGMEYNLNKIISLNIEPVVRYYMTPLSNNSGVVTSPFSFGVFSGLFFRF
jgi:hypothetical protein